MKPKDVLDAAATRLTEEKAKTSGPHEATHLPHDCPPVDGVFEDAGVAPRRCRDDGHAESVPREVCAVSF